MKNIKLPQGKYAKVDDGVFDVLAHYTWRLDPYGYALTSIYINGKRKTLSMHRWIMGNPRGLEIDHRNHDPLDNQRANLRVCTVQQNRFNRRRSVNNTTGRTGVYKTPWGWKAEIHARRKKYFLGHFKEIADAIKARERAEKEHFGDFASQSSA